MSSEHIFDKTNRLNIKVNFFTEHCVEVCSSKILFTIATCCQPHHSCLHLYVTRSDKGLQSCWEDHEITEENITYGSFYECIIFDFFTLQ